MKNGNDRRKPAGWPKHLRFLSKGAGAAGRPSGSWVYLLFLGPSLLGVSVFTLIPFLDVIRRSFVDVSKERFCGFKNYQAVCSNQAFRLALGNTGKFLAVCVPLLLALSLLLANLAYFGGRKAKLYEPRHLPDKPKLFRRGRAKASMHEPRHLPDEPQLFRKGRALGARAYQKVSLLPMAIPAACLAFVWKMIFHRYGLLNSWLGTSADWLNSPRAFGVLTASFLWKNTGYYAALWLTGLGQIPNSLYEAASLDGAGPLARFWYVTLPGLKPMAAAAFILALTGALKSYREAWLLAGEYPDASIYMIQHLFHNWFRDMSLEKMAAGAVILVCIFTALAYPFRKKGGGNPDTWQF